MYPSPDDAYFGVFVKNFCDGIDKSENISIIAKSVIKGQGRSFTQKLKKYFTFYSSILFNSFFKNYDIIYVHNVSHSILPLYPVLIRKLFKKFLIILNPHGEDMIITHKLDGILLKLSLPLIKVADQIVVPSQYYKKRIVELHNLKAEKMFVSASGGINLELFNPKNNGSHKHHLKRLGYVSRLDASKGWDTFLYAISKLVQKEEFKDLKVVFVGKGASTAEFLKLIDDLKLNAYVEYLGFKSQTELPLIFNTLDTFVFPTKMFESLGLVGLEAMACGIPVIGSDRGGLTDYLHDGHNGYKFICGDVDSLVNKVTTFYRLNDDEVLALKRNAIQTSERFSRRNVSDAMINNLLEIGSKV